MGTSIGVGLGKQALTAETEVSASDIVTRAASAVAMSDLTDRQKQAAFRELNHMILGTIPYRAFHRFNLPLVLTYLNCGYR